MAGIEQGTVEVTKYNLRPRRGACSAVDHDTGTAYIFRGFISKDKEEHISAFDFNSKRWIGDKEFLKSGCESPRVVLGACCTIINKKLILFGGFGGWSMYNSVFELDLTTMEWKELTNKLTKTDDKRPMCKNKCGMVPYGDDMVYIFGGYGYSEDTPLQEGAQYIPDETRLFSFNSWTNEQHLFHLKDRAWIIPKTTGVRPPPCAAFSMNKIDPFRVVIFGGRQLAERVHDIHILDMFNWHWSGVIMPTDPEQPWPSKRLFHTAVPLYDPNYVPTHVSSSSVEQPDWLPCPVPKLPTLEPMNIINEQQLLVLWGMDNNGDPNNGDPHPSQEMAWVLYLNTMTWKKVELPSKYCPRAYHTTDVYYPSPLNCTVMTMGGVTENLFAKASSKVATSNEIIILEYGVQSLQDMCLKKVANSVKSVDMLRHLLPDRIIQNLQSLI